MKKKIPSECSEKERGTSLIEVMAALLIMLFLMIGVLQLFTMAFMVNMGSGARTEMTSKAEQMVNNIRYLQYLTKPTTRGGLGKTVPTAYGSTGITFPIVAASSGTLNPTSATYWGPKGVNVFPYDTTNTTPYKVSYTIQDGTPSASFWLVTVTVQATDVSGARKYQGLGLSRKRVDYVAQVPK